MKNKITYPECNGQGSFMEGHNSFDSIDCGLCHGVGKLSKIQYNNYLKRKEHIKKLIKKWTKKNKT